MLNLIKLSPLIFTSPPRSLSSFSFFSSHSTVTMPSISVIDHIVLFKVRDSTDRTLTESMISNLRSLSSLNFTTHLTAGPILRPLSPAAESLGFTHLLFSRYKSKSDLSSYASHPSHLAVVNNNVHPICDDIISLDWIAELDDVAPPLPGSLLRIALAKPREGATAAEIVKEIDGIRVAVPESVRVSYGENFSARAKGYELGFVLVFPGMDEVEEMEGSVEVKRQKEKVWAMLESAIVVDYLVPSLVSSI